MRTISSAALGAAVAIAFPAAAPAQSAAPTFPSDGVTAAVAAMLTSQKAPSATVEVAQNGTVIYSHAFGLRDVAAKLPAGVDTRYEIGSMTKQFTAAAILQLQEAHKLSIDKDVATYLPDAPHAREITLRQLLNQRSGLADYTEVPDFVEISGTPGSYAKIVALIRGKALRFPPGSRWEYSDTNYILLGRIVEVASGERYNDYIRVHEFLPAGMTQTTTIEHEKQTPDMARGYTLDKGRVVPSPPLDDGWAWSAGNIVSTVGDYKKWIAALTSGKIVSPANYALMTTATPGNRMDPKSAYGFGFVIDQSNGQPKIWHNGGTNGFHTYGALFPNQGMRLAVFTNLDTALPEAIGTKIFDLAYPQFTAATAAPGDDPAIDRLARRFWDQLASGEVDRSLLTPDFAAQLTPSNLTQVRASIATLGEIRSFTFVGKSDAGKVSIYRYALEFAGGAEHEWDVTITADDKIADSQVAQ